MGQRLLPHDFDLSKFSLTGLVLPILLFLIFCLFFALIQVQHQIRHLQTNYAQALQMQLQQQESWSKLTLEKHHLTALARVQKLAQTKLNMEFKSAENSQIIFIEKYPNLRSEMSHEQ